MEVAYIGKPRTLTVTVRSLRVQHDGAEILVGIVLDDGEHREQKNLPLTMEQYCEIKPTKGEIDEVLYDRIETASALCSAIRCGENLLSYGSNSVQMLAQKIARHGFSRDTASLAAKKLCEMGLVDETRDMKREIEKCLQKLWGSKRIRAHLWTRGFAADLMESIPQILESVDFEENCVRLIRKHYVDLPTAPEDQKRMIASLSRYGYTLGEIRAAMDAIRKNEK